MRDISEIIYGLKCLSGCTILCRNCAYSKNGKGRYGCRQDCANDAIEMLKEQKRQLDEYHKADMFLAVHGWWGDNPPWGVPIAVDLD